MSDVRICPTCGAKAKYKEKDTEVKFTAIQDEEALKKVGQMKKVIERFKVKAETLEKELELLKFNKHN